MVVLPTFVVDVSWIVNGAILAAPQIVKPEATPLPVTVLPVTAIVAETTKLSDAEHETVVVDTRA